jgi:hypothetical protein
VKVPKKKKRSHRVNSQRTLLTTSLSPRSQRMLQEISLTEPQDFNKKVRCHPKRPAKAVALWREAHPGLTTLSTHSRDRGRVSR